MNVEAELKETLRALVAIDSTSSRSNGPVIDFLAPRLERAGFALRRHRYLDEAGTEKVNLIAERGPGAERLALVGHTDCVPFDPAWEGALRLEEQDGRLFGRGACDTKAFIACALSAASRTRAPLTLIFTADEEVGCVGAKRLLDERAVSPRFAIVGEPTSLRPIRANKGYCLAEVEVKGREGHSAYPAAGASAIFRAARFLNRIEQAARALEQEQDPSFTPGYTTVNVGVIQGGKAKNIIPGSCRFVVEWRPIPSQPVEKVAQLLEEIAAALAAEEPGFVAEVRTLRADRGADTPARSELVRFLSEASGRATDTVSFGTEAPQLAALGAEAVVFGPGDIQVAHRTGEYVPVDELVRCEAILSSAIERFSGTENVGPPTAGPADKLIPGSTP